MEVGNNFFTSKDRSSYKILYNIIQKAQANNEFIKTKTAAEITTFIWIIVRGIIYDWCVNNGSYDLETFLKKYIKDILQTFLK